MPRHPRFVIPDYPHHLTARGNYRQPIFFCDSDRALYLRLLYRACEASGVSIHAYCLMTNHVHLVATPQTDSSFQTLFRDVHSHYARLVHENLARKGHLFESRYFSTVVDRCHYWNAMVYVEQNPVRANLVQTAWDWEWSSARAHIGNCADELLDPESWVHSPEHWRVLLEHGLADGELVLRIREATRTGWPLGDDDFIHQLERDCRIRARPLRTARPKSKHAATC